jgi:hypothetical protein
MHPGTSLALRKDLDFMRKARWLTALLVALAGSGVAHGQGVFTFAPWGFRDFAWEGRFGWPEPRPRLVYSFRLSSPPLVTYFGNPFVVWPSSGITVVSYSPVPAVPLPPVAVVERPRREINEEQELDRLLQQLDIPRPQPQPPAAPPLPPGAPVSVFRPILPEDRVRAQQPARPDEPPPPPKPPLPPLPGPAVAEADPKLAYAQQITLGKEAFAAGEYGRAERRFEQAATIRADEPEAHFLLAQAQFALGKYQEASAAIQAGLRSKPSWPNSGFQVRPLYGANVQDFSDQLKRLADALAKYPEDPALLFLYGYELWFDNRRDEARVIFQRARSTTSDPTFCDRFLDPPPAPDLVR